MAGDSRRRGPLWDFFRELREAVERGNAGEAAQPYAPGDFMVHAEADEVELTVRDVSEEDAVLITSELRAAGVRAVMRGQRTCPACGRRVPDQDHCIHCRAPLRRADAPDTPDTPDADEAP